MSDYIEREAVLSHYKKCSFAMVKAVIAYIEDLPAVDVAPVRHGKWEWRVLRNELYPRPLCSLCGDEPWRRSNHVSDLPRYCPHCGAKMYGGDDDATD